MEKVCFVTDRKESIYIYQWSKWIEGFITQIKKYIHVQCLLIELVKIDKNVLQTAFHKVYSDPSNHQVLKLSIF